jgi:hypothetical protein
MAILERIANGENVADPFEIDIPIDVMKYLPEVLKRFVESTNTMLALECIKFEILDAFREAYLFVQYLYPQLEAEEPESVA